MGKGFTKRLAAGAMSAALLVSAAFSAGTGMTVQAASKTASNVSLRTSFKTLKVNETVKMTLKNNTIDWKITKVETENKAIATVYKKTASGFMMKGKSEGRTKIKVTLKTAKRKKNNTKALRCTVNVIAKGTQTQEPENPETPVITTSKTVTGQAELDAALADGNLKEITIDTKEKQVFDIKAGDYSGVSLIVKAPQSDITNNAKFKSIDIQQIAGDTWQENASGNTLRITASSARIIVGANGVIRDISFAGTDANVKLVVNGKVENVTVSAKLTINISSDLTEKPNVPLTIDAMAKGASVTAQIPLNLTIKATDTVVDFKKGAEGSKVNAEVKTTIKNNSSSSIAVTGEGGRTQQVTAGSSSTINAGTQSSSGSTGGGSGSSSGSSGSSSNTPSVTYYKVSFNGKEVRVAAGKKINPNDVPVMVKRNGDGYKFSGWYYQNGTDAQGLVKWEKFDLNSVINRKIELYPRWGMTEEDRKPDIRGKLVVQPAATTTTPASLCVNLEKSEVTVAIGNDEKVPAVIVKINDERMTDTNQNIVQFPASEEDGTYKLNVIIRPKPETLFAKFAAEISLPVESVKEGSEFDLSSYDWRYYTNGAEVSSQEELDEALLDLGVDRITIVSGSAITISGEQSRTDVRLLLIAPGAVVKNYAVFQSVFIGGDNCVWEEFAKGNTLDVINETSTIVVKSGSVVNNVNYDRGGDGKLEVRGTVKYIAVWNDLKNGAIERAKSIYILGETAANIPCEIFGKTTKVVTEIPLDVVIYETAADTSVEFKPGSANSTVKAYRDAEILNHSGGVVDVKK